MGRIALIWVACWLAHLALLLVVWWGLMMLGGEELPARAQVWIGLTGQSFGAALLHWFWWRENQKMKESDVC